MAVAQHYRRSGDGRMAQQQASTAARVWWRHQAHLQLLSAISPRGGTLCSFEQWVLSLRMASLNHRAVLLGIANCWQILFLPSSGRGTCCSQPVWLGSICLGIQGGHGEPQPLGRTMSNCVGAVRHYSLIIMSHPLGGSNGIALRPAWLRSGHHRPYFGRWETQASLAMLPSSLLHTDGCVCPSSRMLMALHVHEAPRYISAWCPVMMQTCLPLLHMIMTRMWMHANN